MTTERKANMDQKKWLRMTNFKSINVQSKFAGFCTRGSKYLTILFVLSLFLCCHSWNLFIFAAMIRRKRWKQLHSRLLCKYRRVRMPGPLLITFNSLSICCHTSWSHYACILSNISYIPVRIQTPIQHTFIVLQLMELRSDVIHIHARGNMVIAWKMMAA